MNKKRFQYLLISLVAISSVYFAQAQNILSDKVQVGGFELASEKEVASILYDANEDSLVHKAARLFQHDIESVTGKLPFCGTTMKPARNVLLVGNIQHSSFLRKLIKDKKLDVSRLQNQWEAYQIQVIDRPFKGVAKALVIAGSDRRGTAYGLFELSRQMGVSPWYWWADVPVQKKKQLYVSTRTLLLDAPKVKYRGIFLNDEAPALANWSKEKFGGFNHHFYEKVFELILRLKANYLWPAMWGSAFNDDDTLNPVVAHQWGVVMGTSHHEPMLRSQQEWKRFGRGAWDYNKNDSALRAFWRKGMAQMGQKESLITIAMRGDGDEPMTEGTATELLERIVKDQRQIIEEVTGKAASQTPQLWALYKEVQDYYDKGMRVPDDVTLLLCDDNWGNLRKLPRPGEKPRRGGYGIYYHYDYVGGPRNYKWINTNNLARVWEQMHLAYEHHVRQIWIVNVGDLKPMELPISFFLDYGWNPEKWHEGNLRSYYSTWAGEQFGRQQAKQIGDLLRLYAQYSARRKPELLDEKTYTPEEWQRVVGEWDRLEQRAENIQAALAAPYRDAYFQLVLHPVKALANLHRLYQAVALNRWFAAQKTTVANGYADKAKQLYAQDSLLSLAYHSIAGGKWNHMMSQTHIGYTYWQQPPFNKMPEVKYVADNAAAAEVVKIDVVSKTAEQLIPGNSRGHVFFEKDGYVCIEAEHFTRAINTNGIQWKVIPDIGRTGSGMSTFPVSAAEHPPGAGSAQLEYEFYSYDTGRVALQAFFSPTLNVYNSAEGLQYAVAIDGEAPQVISVNKEEKGGVWNTWVANNIIIKKTFHQIRNTGRHTLRFYRVSPGVVLQKLVLDFGGLQPSYLGPQETIFNNKSSSLKP